MHEIELTAEDGHVLGAVIAHPQGEPKGGIVIVQEIFGLNLHIRNLVEDYARRGYRTVAPALFDRVERGVERGYGPTGIEAGRAIREQIPDDTAIGDILAAAQFLEGLRVAVIGYCWGGTLAWKCAAELEIEAAVAYYGGGIAAAIDMQPQCPVMLHFGEKDAHIPMADVKKLQARYPDIPVFTYPAGHGFNCDHRADYHKESAELALQRTLEFLETHVGADGDDDGDDDSDA